MDQLAQALRDSAQEKTLDTPAYVDGLGLRNAATQWATFALENYRDGLLANALAVSAAIANFLAEMESPS